MVWVQKGEEETLSLSPSFVLTSETTPLKKTLIRGLYKKRGKERDHTHTQKKKKRPKDDKKKAQKVARSFFFSDNVSTFLFAEKRGGLFRLLKEED